MIGDDVLAISFCDVSLAFTILSLGITVIREADHAEEVLLIRLCESYLELYYSFKKALLLIKLSKSDEIF